MSLMQKFNVRHRGIGLDSLDEGRHLLDHEGRTLKAAKLELPLPVRVLFGVGQLEDVFQDHQVGLAKHVGDQPVFREPLHV